MRVSQNFKPYLAYSASAGSGKTFALAVRYISLLFMGESPSSILAATFTNKAASEMRHRVIESLRGLDQEKNRPFFDAIVSETGISRDELLAKQPEVLDRFLSSRSSIVTLDSFFSSILRSASLELGLEPDFTTKEISDSELENHFLDELYRDGTLSTLVKLSMDIEDKRLLKIFDMMQDFYRVDPLLPPPNKIESSLLKIEEQIESLRLDMISALSGAKAAQRAIKQFETSSIKELFSKSLFAKEYLGEHSWYKKCIDEDIESIYSRLRGLLKEWAKTKEAIVLHALFEIYDYYKNATITNMKSSGILTFDDLTYMTYRLLYESISREFLYFKMDSKYRHILLDEFQDTATLQFLLLKPLIDEIFAGEGQSEFKSFFYVGDTKQSLYRFRGGVEELFDMVADHYGITIEQMDTNYRSSKIVVSKVNEWFRGVMPNYVAQKSSDRADDGYLRVIESDEVIASAIEQIEYLIYNGIAVDDIALLVNTNRDGQTLQEQCELKGIPTMLQTTSSLKYNPKIASIMAMISYLFYGEEIDSKPILQKIGSTIDEIDISWFSPFMEPIVVVDRVVREFGYFDGDKSILKLLEFASNYSDIATLLDEFDSSSISIGGDISRGAKIMTIHGSKGLEFEHVIVLDRLTRKNSDRSYLIYHYNDTLHIEKILYRISKRDNFDDEYRAILKKRELSSQKDHLNVLYVALTRAVYGLSIIKKSKESTFEPLNIEVASLGDLRVDKRTYSLQEPKSITPIKLTHYGRQDIKNHDDDGDTKDIDAILFGTALHYTLEMMGNFTRDDLDIAMVSLLNRYGQQLKSDKIIDIEQRISALISHQEFRTLLKDANISKELPISFDGELKQIDLFLDYGDTSIVIDYKSSTKYESSHKKQVSYYQKAIESLTQKRCRGVLIYLLEDEIVIKNLK
ncbi:Helicase [hydrothermal vent metagenome]|uniref:Helicase n=1 Tax=hydrothermal vent metagenome TaxID=652676 RepID=A0A1W1BH99_9ZZZZ